MKILSLFSVQRSASGFCDFRCRHWSSPRFGFGRDSQSKFLRQPLLEMLPEINYFRVIIKLMDNLFQNLLQPACFLLLRLVLFLDFKEPIVSFFFDCDLIF